MKYLIIVFVIAFSVSAKAQRTEEYCEMLAAQKFMSSKLEITVDYGEKRRQAVVDEQGKWRAFNTIVDALNYMNEDGWELLDAYLVTVSNQNVYHYLLKRKIKQ